jgi:hypothetical protein
MRQPALNGPPEFDPTMVFSDASGGNRGRYVVGGVAPLSLSRVTTVLRREVRNCETGGVKRLLARQINLSRVSRRTQRMISRGDLFGVRRPVNAISTTLASEDPVAWRRFNRTLDQFIGDGLAAA